MNDSITINTDGGSRGNPGPAAYAFVVKKDGDIIYEQKETIGVATNNKAEYTGVMKALEWLLSHTVNFSHIAFILDSELVVRQLTGVYKVKDQNISNYVREIRASETKLAVTISYHYVPRKDNWEADALVNAALDGK